MSDHGSCHAPHRAWRPCRPSCASHPLLMDMVSPTHSLMSRPPSDPSHRWSNNPFRQDLSSPSPAFALNRSASSVYLSGSAFEEWVSKNKQLLELSDEEDIPRRPAFPAQSRTGSDSNVNYGRYVYLLGTTRHYCKKTGRRDEVLKRWTKRQTNSIDEGDCSVETCLPATLIAQWPIGGSEMRGTPVLGGCSDLFPSTGWLTCFRLLDDWLLATAYWRWKDFIDDRSYLRSTTSTCP